MISNFSEIFDQIYNENMNNIENSKERYIKYSKSEKYLTFKKVLCFIVIIITFPIFPVSLLWDIPLVMYLNNQEVKQLKKDDGDYVNILSKYLILPMLNKIFGATRYDMLNGIERAHYNIASYNEEYDTFASDDLVEMPINDNKFILKTANVFTQKEETYYDVDDNIQTRIENVFGGRVAMIELPFNINANMVITQDQLTTHVIELDMKDFETKFNVSSTNEVLAFQLLTTDVMHKLLEMRNDLYKVKFDVVINNNMLYIRFQNKTAFNFKIDKNIDKKLYQESIENLEIVKNMSEDILNIVLNSNVG